MVISVHLMIGPHPIKKQSLMVTHFLYLNQEIELGIQKHKRIQVVGAHTHVDTDPVRRFAVGYTTITRIKTYLQLYTKHH